MAGAFAFAVPAVVALIAVYVRAKCPESPYWVRMQDRKRRIADMLAAGQPLSAADQGWLDKANKIPLRQLFLPDMRRNTAVATFVACCSTTIYGTVGGWMPLYLAQERHWSTATYGTFYIWWGLVGFLGLLAAGWISDRFGRRPAFYIMLAEGAIFLTLWVYAKTDTELWIYGLLWSIGFLGFWAPSMILTAEVYPTRIRGVGNGFSWSIAWLVGFVLWPFVPIALQQQHRLVRRGVPGHSGGDAADGGGDLGVHPRACGQGTRRHQRVMREDAGVFHPA